MLRELRIKNLAIIKNLDLEMKENFIVLTGETGAGKSIILDGINLLIGEKVSFDMIRKDAEFLSAEGVFDIKEDTKLKLKEIDIDTNDELIIKRVMEKNGKNKTLCNEQRISLPGLKNIMEDIVDLVGQHSHQMLLNKNQHIKLVDNFLDDEGKNIKIEIKDIYNKYLEVNAKIYETEEKIREMQEKKDLYLFQFEEINKLSIKENEDEELEKEYKILFNAGKIKDNLSDSVLKLREGNINVLSFLSSVKNNIEKILTFYEEFKNIYDKLDTIYYDVEEIFYALENKLEDIETDENRLNEVITRLDEIKKLKLKYGSEIKDIINYKNELKEKISYAEDNNIEIEGLKNLKKELEENYEKKSIILSQKRRKIADDIEYKLVNELYALNMKGIQFKVDFKENVSMNLNGKDSIEFLISTNVGEDMKPLSKIVSGGEISRIMLSLKSVFSKVDNVSLLIFDEIDTGIGGETVKRVAEKLEEISKNSQVICITHSPHIAAKAKQHFYIEKRTINNETVTFVEELNKEQRVEEISRMLSGDTKSEIVRQHAEELLRGEE